ncbi:MAG TPA: DUF6328 family protein [Solirubrobacteraceae bacterium]|nr:DUF6328 family protein [Solirubrobacteraceae bacterium]
MTTSAASHSAPESASHSAPESESDPGADPGSHPGPAAASDPAPDPGPAAASDPASDPGPAAASDPGPEPAPRPAHNGREETTLEQLDRNTIELLNELRVAGTGIQVLLAFLLVAPFDNRFAKLTAFERYDYFVTLVCIAVAAMLLIAPSIHHRILFRHRQKAYLLRVGNQAMIVAMVFLAVGLTGILVLISDLMFGGTAAAVAGVLAGLALGAVWFALPLTRRGRPAERT